MAKKSNFTGLFGYGNSLTNYTKNLIPNNRARYNLTAIDGTDFGTVSYDAMEAVKNNTLDRYKPKSKKEKHTIENFRKYQHISLPGSDYKVSYDAYSAINNGNLGSYKPKTDDEKKAIKAFKNTTYLEVPVTDKKTVKVKYADAEYIDKNFIAKSNDEILAEIHKTAKSDDDVAAARSYLGLKLLADNYKSNEATKEKYATGWLANFGAGMDKAVRGTKEFIFDKAFGLSAKDYNETYNNIEKYYNQNPDELGFLLAQTSVPSGALGEYVHRVKRDGFMNRYSGLSDTVKFIYETGFGSAGEMLGSYMAGTWLTGGMGLGGAASTGISPGTAMATKASSALSKTKAGSKALNIINATPKIKAVASTGVIGKVANATIGKVNSLSVKSAAKFLNPFENSTTAIMGINAAQDKYRYLRRMGYSDKEATANAMFTGYVSAITEKMGYNGKTNLFKMTTTSRAKNIFNTAKRATVMNVSEGLEEVYANVLERGGEYFSKIGYIDESGNLQQRTFFGENGVIDPLSMAESFAGGFVGGAVMGGAGVVSNVLNADIESIHKYADDIKAQTDASIDAIKVAAKSAGIENVELPKAPNWKTASVQEIADYAKDVTQVYNDIVTDEKVVEHDRKVLEKAAEVIEKSIVTENTETDSVQTDVSAPVETVQQGTVATPAATTTVTPTNVFTSEADELASTEVPTVSVGDTFTDTKTGNTIRVVSRDAQNTTVEIDTGSKVETRVYNNKQADTLAVNDQYEQIATEEVPAETAEKRNISLTKIGDFYSAFNDDAVELADKLGLKLVETTRHGEPIKLVGFPVRYLDTYASKLGDSYNFTVEEQPSVTSTNPENMHVSAENTPENVPVTNTDVAKEDNLPEAFRRDDDGEIRFNQLEINYDNATMRNGQFKIGKTLNSDATSETVNGMICGKYGIYKTPEGQYNVLLLTSGFTLKTFDKLKEAKTAVLYLDEHLAFNDVSFKRGISGTFYLKQTDELKKYLSEAKQILDNKKYDTAVPATTDIQNGKVPFSTKSGLINYVKAHIGDRVHVTFDNGISEVRTLEDISNTNLRTKKPDGSASNAELKGIKYNDTGFSIDYNTGVSVNYDFVNVGEETKTTITENLNKTSNKDLQTSFDNDIIEESTSENEGNGISYAVFDNSQILDGDNPNNNTDGGNEDVRNGVLDTESGRNNERDVSDSVSETEKEERASKRDGSDSEVSNEGVRENVRAVEDDETAREQRPDRNLDNELREREPGEGDGGRKNILSDSGTGVTEKRNTKNYVLGNEIDDVRPNETDNIAAIKLLKELEASGKQPTKAQKDVLARYKGFGGLKHMFLGYQSRTLENLLTEKEYKNAKATINDSFYTPTKVIDSIYKGIRQLGFTGGVVLEPSLGTGNFFGRMPRVLSASSQLHGVEIDSLTGRIASMLYPDADIKIAPFQDTNFKEGSFDLVIGNVPFSEVTYNYKKGKYSLHDYFFLKSLDLTSDGGLCVFLTSTGTLDKLNPKARNEIMKRANVVASYRLPSGTFSKNAATDVTTDLIFLQKRAEGEESTGESIENIGELNGIPINEYYVKNPKNILGKLVYESNQFGGMSSSVKNDGDLYKVLNRAMSKLPKDLLTGKTVLEPLSVEISESDKPHFVEKDGRIGFVDGTSSEVLEFSGKKAERARGYIRIKGLYNDLLNASAENRPTGEIRKELNSEYDKFVKSFGNLQDNANRFLNDDTDFIRVSGLELYNPKTKGYTKSDIFTKDTVGYKPPKTADNSTDALAISVNETGGINFKRMQQLTGKTKEELAEDLKDKIIMTPDGDYELIDVYLSGNVREKYKAVEGKPGFERNAELLKAVIPADKTASEIKPQLGATWIEPKYISGFIKETFETYHNPEVNYDKTTGTWSMSKNIWGNRQLSNVKYGTSRISAFELTELTLNMKSASIYDRVGDNRVLNKKETQLARQKQQEIKEAFENWIFKDKTRRDELVTTYNERFNSNANMQYGSLAEYLTFPGLSESFKLRDYQKSAVARVVFGGNTLLAHGVGTGKTAEMIASAMELKRMGIVKKNMMIVPKHKVGDFRSDILKMYPEAKVLMATEKDFTKQNRAKLFSKIATNDWDIVVIGHTSFNLIPVKPETQGAFIEEEIADLESVITSAKIENGQNLDKRFLSQLEKTKKAKEEQLKELLATKKDDTLPFEDMGIDSIFVDEAHNFKNLPFYTKLNVPGIRSGTAKRAQDLYMKANYLRNKGGRTTFATATPITNTVSELYNMTRYIRPDLLRDAGIYSFDGWAATFGTVETKVEISPDGRTFRTKERFSKYHNVPEMIGMSRMFMDVLKTADVVKELPKAEYIDVISPATDIHDSYVESITDRMKNVSSRGQNTTDNMLLITNDGRAMATDLRLVASQLEGYDVSELDVPESKINQCVRNIVKEYKDSTGRKGTQFVFLDFGISDNEGARYGYNLYNDLINKLVAAGIPQAEIAKIGDYETTAKKDVLFEKVNEGSVRVLIGSTAKMGEGMNAQNKSVALHHLNAPYRPSDIEQREGRILRFGNENKNVRIYRYIQEKSFDSYMWQMLARKAEFINQAMSDGNVTELEETDEFVLNAKTGMAIATGNPLILEKVEIDEEVKRLQMLQKSYKSNLFDMEDRLAKLPMQIERAEDVVSKMEADLATVKKNATDDFSITIGKTKYDKRADAGTALEKAIKNAPKNGTKTAVGSFKGLALSYIGSIETGQKIVIDGEYSYTIDISSSGLGNITRIANEVDKIEQHLNARKMILDNLNKELSTIKTDIKKEFAYQSQLDEMLRKQADINAQLNMDKVNEDDVSDIIEEMDGEFDDEAEDSEVSYSIESEELSSEQRKNLLSNGIGERNNGKSSGRPVKKLDGRTSRYRESHTTAFERREYCRTLKASGKIEQKVIHKHQCDVIPKEAYTHRMEQIESENKDFGIDETIFITGKAVLPFIKDANGNRVTAKGILIESDNKKTMIVQYDNEFFMPEQIRDHELIHQNYSSESIQKVKDIIWDNLSKSEKKTILNNMARAYNGIINGNEELLIEEFIANTISGMNKYTNEYNDLVKAYWNNNDFVIDNYKVSEYTESTDSGGSDALIAAVGFGEEYRLFENANNDIPFSESRQLEEYIMSANHGNKQLKSIGYKEIGNHFYIWKNSSRTDYNILDSVDIEGNEDDIDFLRGEFNDINGRTERISDDVEKVIRRYGSSSSSSFIDKNGSANVQNGAVSERKSEEREVNGDRRGNTGESSGDTSDDSISYSLDVLETVDNEISELTPERKKQIFEQFERERAGVPKVSAKQAWGERASWVAHNMTRVFPDIPERGERGTFFAEFRKMMIQWKSLPNTASFMAQDKLNQMTDGLTPDEYKTFSELVYFLDLQEEAQIQKERGYDEILLPNEITAHEVDEIVDELNEEASDKVKEALKKRQSIWDELKEQYVALNQYIGFNTDSRFKRKNYYHHQVIEYMSSDSKGTGSRNMGIKAGRGWLKERHGSTMAINTDFLAVEYKAILQMQYDVYVANMLGKIKNQYDIKPKLEQEAFDSNKKLLNDLIAEEATGEDGNVRLDSKGNPDSDTYRQQKWYNQRIMFGFSGLFDLAETNSLPELDGQYGNVIRALKKHSLNVPGLYKYVGDLASTELAEENDAYEQAQISARTVMKYTSQKKAWIRETLGEDYQTWESIAETMSDTHSIHQPRRGNYFYTKTTIDEDAFNTAFSEMVISLAAGEGGLEKSSDIKKLFAQYSDTVRLMGAAFEQWVLPNEIVSTMDAVANPKQTNVGQKLARSIVSAWKGWSTSINPLRTVKFGIRNLFGDLDAVIAGNPKIVTKSKQAVQEIYQAMKYRKYTPEFMEWVERGGYTSMIFANEMDSEMQDKLFSHLKGKDGFNIFKIPAKLFEGYYNGVETAHNFREAILRYSAYLHFKQEIAKNGGEVKDNVASNRYIVKGLQSVEDKAYQLSKDLLGAYDEVAMLGQTLRRYFVPFYSFTETNMKRYYRLFENVITADDTIPKKAGKLLVKGLMVNMLGLLLVAWNRIVKRDEDDELPPSVRNVPHLTLGKIGDDVYAFRQLGSFSEILEWLGFEDYKWTKEDLVAPVDKAWGMITPFVKLPIELVSGLNFYPSLAQPRTIRDRWEHLFNSFGLDDVYREVAGKPTKGVGDIAKGSIVYTYDYKESAYYEILDLKYNFQGDEGGDIYKPDKKANALYYMKTAIRYKDRDAALKYLDEYFENGGTGKGIAQSISMLNPMYGFTGKETAAKGEAFVASLSEDDKEKLKIAQRYYEDDLMLPEKVATMLRQKGVTDKEAKNLLRNYIATKCR